MQSNILPIYHQYHSINGPQTKQNSNSSKFSYTNLNSKNSNLLLNNVPNTIQDTANIQKDDQLKDTCKIKSPMCLVNELARSCKIEHKYILEDEKGPAHKKIFTIRLILGSEEYVMDGSSIKKAQHAAASFAIKSTNYKFQPRNKRNHFDTKSSSVNKCITPTVELNGLVMKRGQPVTYSIIEKPRQIFYPRTDASFPNYFRQNGSSKQLFVVRLNVGVRQYMGHGSTVKAARNHAAEQALHELANIPHTNKTVLNNGDAEKEETNKSVMMQVHDLVHKRKMNIKFEMLRETGPSHLRIYVMQCSSGDLKAEGEGRSKKAAKNKAAENLLPHLLKLPPLEFEVDEKPKKLNKIRKKKNLNKMSSLNPEYGSNMNPSSRLLQIQQAKKEPLPIFKFVDHIVDVVDGEESNKDSGFTVEVTVGDKICTGVGPNKKLAKRVAAEEMLKLLGYYPTPTVPTKPALKIPDNQPKAIKIPESKVSFTKKKKVPTATLR